MRTRSVLLVAFASVVSQFAGGGFAPAEAECLAGPTGLSPPGRHWFYRLDRVDHRKCWYLGPIGGRKASAGEEVVISHRSRPRLRMPATAAAPPLPPAAEPAQPATAEEPVGQPAYATAPSYAAASSYARGPSYAAAAPAYVPPPSYAPAPSSAPVPTVKAETLGQASRFDDPPPVEIQVEDDMPSVWPPLTASDRNLQPGGGNLQPGGGTPPAPGMSWFALLAWLAGSLLAARFLPALIVDVAASRRFDALAQRINAFVFAKSDEAPMRQAPAGSIPATPRTLFPR